MRCPICDEAGVHSQVTVEPGEQTCVGWFPFFYEEGRFHSHDPNRYTERYSCSEGHHWSSCFYKRCWCQRTLLGEEEQ